MFIVFHFKLLLTIFEGNIPPLTTDRFQPVNLLVLTQGPLNRELDESSRILLHEKSRHSKTPEGFHHVGLLFNSPVNTHRHAIYLVVRNISGLYRKRLRTFCHPTKKLTEAIQIAIQFYHLFILCPLWTFNFSLKLSGFA